MENRKKSSVSQIYDFLIFEIENSDKNQNKIKEKIFSNSSLEQINEKESESNINLQYNNEN